MDKGWLFVALIGIAVIGSGILLTPALAGREMSIPPTNAFSTIIIGNYTVTADNYNSIANLTGQIDTNIIGAGSISCASVDGVFTCKLKAMSCPLLQGIKGIDANGNMFCAVI